MRNSWIRPCFIADIIHDSILFRNYSMPILVIKSKEVMKILLRQIHQTGEVRGKLGASVLMLCGRTVHTHAPCPPKGERATLLLESSEKFPHSPILNYACTSYW